MSRASRMQASMPGWLSTTAKLLRYLPILDMADPWDRGIVMGLQRTVSGGQTRPPAFHICQELLDSKEPRPRRTEALPTVPWSTLVRPDRGDPPGLDAADIRWLDTLPDPSRPEQFSVEQVCHLANLDQKAAGESDRMLVGAWWKPVRDYHERVVRVAELEAELPPANELKLPADAITRSIDKGYGRKVIDALADEIQAAEFARIDDLAQKARARYAPTAEVDAILASKPTRDAVVHKLREQLAEGYESARAERADAIAVARAELAELKAGA